MVLINDIFDLLVNSTSIITKLIGAVTIIVVIYLIQRRKKHVEKLRYKAIKDINKTNLEIVKENNKTALKLAKKGHVKDDQSTPLTIIKNNHQFIED